MSTHKAAYRLALLPVFLFLGCADKKSSAPSTDAVVGASAVQPSVPGTHRVTVSVWTPGRILWHLDINRNGNGSVGFIGLPESYFAEGTFSTAEVVRKLMPTLRTEDTGGNPYSVWIADEESRTRYYPSDFNAVAALFGAVRPHMTLNDIEELEMHPPPGLALPTCDWEEIASELSRSSISGPARSKVMPPEPEQIKRVLVEGRPISRDEYRRRHSPPPRPGLSGTAKSPDGKEYAWRIYQRGIALVRTPESEVILLEVSLPATRPATAPSELDPPD